MAISSEIIQEIAEHKIPYMEVPVTVTYTADTLRGSKQGRMPAIKIVRDLFIGKFLR
ncbi:MAG: Glycosyl transferase family 2 [Parcubacteria group bacterium GW2011_GWF2_43_38]|nr:MAG: Glycosyl transferase family 2 [Parcubacteria group bacterium GW2011_GWF2_43_38]